MKKIISLIFILQSFMIVKSQDVTLQSFIDKYDKALSRERTYFFTNDYGMRFPDPDEPCDSTKSLDCCQRFGIQRIEYFEQYLLDTMPNIRSIATQMICAIGANSKIEAVRQRAVVDVLNSVYTAIDVSGVDSYMMFFRAKDFNDTAKNRIKDLLRGKETQYEKKLHFEYEINDFIAHSRYFDVEGHYIAKRDSLPFEYVRDSLVNIEKRKLYKDTIFNDEYNYDGCFKNISLLPGILYMYDFVPEMEQMLQDKKFRDCNYSFKLNLARMGNKQYEDEILKSKDVWFQDIFFINTQSAAVFYVNNFINTDSIICPLEGSSFSCHLRAWDAYYEMQAWILNFPKKYKINSDYDKYNEQKKKFEAGKKWLNKNIGKFELNSNISVNFGFE